MKYMNFKVPEHHPIGSRNQETKDLRMKKELDLSEFFSGTQKFDFSKDTITIHNSKKK